MSEPDVTPEMLIEAAEERFQRKAYVANRIFADVDRRNDWAVYLWENEMRPYHPSRWMFHNSAPTRRELLEKIRGAK